MSGELEDRLNGTLAYIKAFSDMLSTQEKDGLSSDVRVLRAQIKEEATK